MIPNTHWMRPWRLADSGPDPAFFDIPSRFIVAGKEFHYRGRRCGSRYEECREQREDCWLFFC